MAEKPIEDAPAPRMRGRGGAARRIGFGALLALAVPGGIVAGYNLDAGRITAPVSTAPQATALVGAATIPLDRSGDLFAQPMPVCGSGRRVNCVVDGDTIWVAREKIRLRSINAPEVGGDCSRERALAAEATRRLSQLLSARPFSVDRGGTDRYGRTLATVRTGEEDVGMILEREGLAHVWRGRKESWC